MMQKFLSKIMWRIFEKNFSNNLTALTSEDKSIIMRKAKTRYAEIVEMIPPFRKNDILLVNLLSAAMVASVYLSLSEKATVKQMEEFYRLSMNENSVAKKRLQHTNLFSAKRQTALAKEAKKSQKATNPYSWRFTFFAGKSLDNFDAIYDKCGICTLFAKLGISEIVPAMCAYDYEMAKFTDTIFTRETTLASGGSVCDCHYRRKDRSRL